MSEPRDLRRVYRFAAWLGGKLQDLGYALYLWGWSQPRKPWPKSRLRRFIKLARLNYRVGGGFGPSVRVAWKDSRRG
jgi:hypothetical protein